MIPPDSDQPFKAAEQIYDVPEPSEAMMKAIAAMPEEHKFARRFLGQLLERHGFGETISLLESAEESHRTGKSFAFSGAAYTLLNQMIKKDLVSRRKFLSYGVAAGLALDAVRRGQNNDTTVNEKKTDTGYYRPLTRVNVSGSSFEIGYYDPIAVGKDAAKALAVPAELVGAVAAVGYAGNLEQRTEDPGFNPRVVDRIKRYNELCKTSAPVLTAIFKAYRKEMGIETGPRSK